MKAGSDINITCVVKGAIRGAPVTWYHVLPRDPPKEELVEINAGGRGGVQLVTDKNSGTSWLLVTHTTWRDAGNYTCAPMHSTPASVFVHVLDGGWAWAWREEGEWVHVCVKPRSHCADSGPRQPSDFSIRQVGSHAPRKGGGFIGVLVSCRLSGTFSQLSDSLPATCRLLML
ncbi:uncharacterized protein LOC126985514 [Eriocheir sinensis]|uniref:uncharacterized protein LOC126985514 n=1 Tax=Eriocheir sinensis TaxID=95602 RepID=UPI0021C97DCF|nr:uncharacterized protein LOC126985514 [Eriocheir sinensis]